MGTREPIPLTPVRDTEVELRLGGEPEQPPQPLSQLSREVMCLLTPVRDPATGQVVYVDLEARGGRLYPSPELENGLAESAPLSKLPEDTMAGDTWENIAKHLGADEEGHTGGTEVVLREGGRLEIAKPEQPRQPLSQLPPEVMAAVNAGPSAADIALLRRLDPHNVEDWEPVTSDLIAGWVFRFTPPFKNLPRFAFFAFRSPADGGLYRISVLEPDMDTEYGHLPHMEYRHVGGQRIPIICGPRGKPAADLAAVRTQAAKWMFYTACRMRGLDPGFSR
ncbi:hypothetical protein ACFXG9_13690 [Streptomyces mirabilis]|uniref:hypothetical protein n=1 Tax=Streptomyces mirabilis TaxID=68239 RepID=UPI0036BD2249